jgi:hypothetical protein
MTHHTHALGIDLGPLPERELDPPDNGTVPDLRGEASACILREARDVVWWITLTDDIDTGSIDIDSLTRAMWAAHTGDNETALDLLREAAAATIAVLETEEMQERERDRREALEEDAEEWRQERLRDYAQWDKEQP